MIMTAEITMYPFQDNYIPPIKSFIDKLAGTAGKNLRVQTFPTCTILVGEYASIMDIVNEAMQWSHSELGKAVFLCKFIPGYEAN